MESESNPTSRSSRLMERDLCGLRESRSADSSQPSHPMEPAWPTGVPLNLHGNKAPKGSDYLELATSLHLAAFQSFKDEITELTNQLDEVRTERDRLRTELERLQTEKETLVHSHERTVQDMKSGYDSTVTQLRYKISDLTRRLETAFNNQDSIHEFNPKPSDSTSEQHQSEDNSDNSNMEDAGSDACSVCSGGKCHCGHNVPFYRSSRMFPLSTERGKTRSSSFGQTSLERRRTSDASFGEVPHILGVKDKSVQPGASRSVTASMEVDRLRAQTQVLKDERVLLNSQVNPTTGDRSSRTKVPSCEPINNRSRADSSVVSPKASKKWSLFGDKSHASRTGAESADADHSSPGSKLFSRLRNSTPSAEPRQPVAVDAASKEALAFALSSIKDSLPSGLHQGLDNISTVSELLRAVVAVITSSFHDQISEKHLDQERLVAHIGNLQAQNDVLLVCLNDTKEDLERLTVFFYQVSTDFASMQVSLQDTELLIDAYEVLTRLVESEQDLLMSRCNLAFHFDTMKSMASTFSSKSNTSNSSRYSLGQYHPSYLDEQHTADCDETFALSRHSSWTRKHRDSVTMARQVLLRMEKRFDGFPQSSEHPHGSSVGGRNAPSNDGGVRGGWDESCSSGYGSWTMEEENRLKDYIGLLKNDIQQSLSSSTGTDPQRFVDLVQQADLSMITENRDVLAEHLRLHDIATLVQENKALREEKADLRHRMYTLETEKRGIELNLHSRECQEQVYLLQIDHLRQEIHELGASKALPNSSPTSEGFDLTMSSSASIRCGSITAADAPSELLESQRREMRLKTQVRELLDNLERLSRSSEQRQQQTTDQLTELKRANGALLAAYEKARRRCAVRMRKADDLLKIKSSEYESRISALSDQITSLQERLRRETAL